MIIIFGKTENMGYIHFKTNQLLTYWNNVVIWQGLCSRTQKYRVLKSSVSYLKRKTGKLGESWSCGVEAVPNKPLFKSPLVPTSDLTPTPHLKFDWSQFLLYTASKAGRRGLNPLVPTNYISCIFIKCKGDVGNRRIGGNDAAGHQPVKISLWSVKMEYFADFDILSI